MSDLPMGWEITTLENIGIWSSGGTPSRKHPEYYGGSIPWIKTGDLKDTYIESAEEFITEVGLKNSSAKIFPSGTLLIAMYGATIGKTGLLKIDAATNQACAALIAKGPTKKLIPFLWWFFICKIDEFKAIGQGGAQPNISQTLIKQFPIPLPPLNEQRRIVAKLDILFSHTRKAREELDRVPKLIQRYKQAVLSAACSGQLTEDWREENPDVEPAEELIKQIQKNREQKYQIEAFKLKEQGKNVPKLPEFKYVDASTDIPKNWVSISIESACLFIIDCLHSTPKFITEGEYCVDTTSIEPRKIIWSKVRKVSLEEFIERTNRMLPCNGDIIFSREGTIGTVVRIFDNPRFCLGQRMMMFRFSPLIMPEYAEIYLQSSFFTEQYKPLIIGTSSPHLNIGAIRKMHFCVPPLPEQQEIVRRVEQRFKAIEQMEAEYQKASKLLDRLEQATLSKAFRGELVPQDPNDIPASVLLEHILAEKQSKTTTKRK